jgi:hypothetical protein
MKGQIAPLDIGIIAIALVIFVIIITFLQLPILINTNLVVDIIYDTNEAYRLLASLLSLKYNNEDVYKMVSFLYYNNDENFVKFLNQSLYDYFDYIPKCYKLTLGSKIILEFKKEGYTGDCSSTKFNAKVPIFIHYNNAKLVENLYLNYER